MQHQYTPKQINLFWTKVNKSGGEDACWYWEAGAIYEYGQVRMGDKRKLAHRVSYELEHDIHLDSDILVLHKCDEPRCVNPKHLFLGTHQDNVQDRVNKGRTRTGYDTGNLKHECKYSDSVVMDMRERHVKGASIPQISKELGIPYGTVYSIIKKRARVLVNSIVIS